MRTRTDPVTYSRDPCDTDQPPCFCLHDGDEEFCPAHGDPGKPAPEPPDDYDVED
jgi:hypothetical protein